MRCFFGSLNKHVAHREIRKLIEENIEGKSFWVGMNDRGQQGNFRLVNGTAYDVTNTSQPALYRWLDGEPNNKGEHGAEEDCVHIKKISTGKIGLNDAVCNGYITDITDTYDGRYRLRSYLYGLCEIPTYK